MKTTIKNKLLFSYFIAVMLTLFLVISVLFVTIYIKKTEVTIDLATKLSTIMATNLSASLAFDDKKSAKNILQSLYTDKTIEAALLFDKNNKLFSSYTDGIKLNVAIKKMRLLANNSTYHDIDNIIVTSNIILDKEKIGKLILLYNTDEIKNTLKMIFLILLGISLFVLLIMYKVASILQNKLTKPIYILVDNMKSILKENDYTRKIKEKSNDEFQIVFDGFNTMLNEIQNDKIALEKLANTDPLTGLYNRRHFYELINPFLSINKREKKTSSLIMLDIDKFKNVNDTYGHDVGDIILVNLAITVSANIRESDIFSRFGGEEFMIFLPHTNEEQAIKMAEKLRKAVEASKNVQNIKTTISIGVSEIIDDIEVSIKAVDTALYVAKNNGRNRVEVA